MSVKCTLCDSNKVSFVTDQLRFGYIANVFKCDKCSLSFIDQNSFQFPDKFYETEYHQTYLTHVDPEMLDPSAYYKKMKKASIPWINRIKNILTGNESVLDVGCSTGHILMGIRDKASRIAGSELNHKEISFCCDELGLDVSNISFEKRFEPHSFDLITLIFVLEHIGDPIPFLRELTGYLKPNGKLVIVVPNVLDPLLEFYQISSFRKFYYCIEHLFYYSPKTLEDLLEKAGFESHIEAVQEYPISNHLNWAYLEGPSETLSARQLSPDVKLNNTNYVTVWESFWEETNKRYQDFLITSGYSDRIWAIATVRE